VPSLQGTGPLLLEEPLLPEEPLEAAEDELAAGADVAAGAEAAAAEADLFTPPCPLQAPRPPCGEVVPSLQVTGPLLEVLCAAAMPGAASTAVANTAPHIRP
jgi:hypothetical protein